MVLLVRGVPVLLVPKCTYQLLIASHNAEWFQSYSSAEYLRLPQSSCISAALATQAIVPFASISAEWVRSYSSAEYLRLPAKAEALLDETGGAEDFGALLLSSFDNALLCVVVHIVLCCIRSRNRRRRGLWCVAVHCQRPALADILVCIQLKQVVQDSGVGALLCSVVRWLLVVLPGS